MKILRLIGKLYLFVAAIVMTGLVGLLAAGAASGKLPPARAVALVRSALEPADAPPAAGPAAAEAAPEEPRPAGSQPPAEILSEIERAAEDLKTWEERIDLLGRELGTRLVTAGEKDNSLKEAERRWHQLKKELVPLLNELLAGSPGYQVLSEDSLEAALTSAPAGAGGAPLLEDLLRRLREREAALAGAAKAVQSVAPDVLAGILAAGLKKGGSGGKTGSPPALSEDQAARLLATFEPTKVARVFKALRDESPDQAASLLALVLQGAARAAADPSSIPAETAPAGAAGDRASPGAVPSSPAGVPPSTQLLPVPSNGTNTPVPPIRPPVKAGLPDASGHPDGRGSPKRDLSSTTRGATEIKARGPEDKHA